jgi:hypothetical protein
MNDDAPKGAMHKFNSQAHQNLECHQRLIDETRQLLRLSRVLIRRTLELLRHSGDERQQRE